MSGGQLSAEYWREAGSERHRTTPQATLEAIYEGLQWRGGAFITLRKRQRFGMSCSPLLLPRRVETPHTIFYISLYINCKEANNRNFFGCLNRLDERNLFNVSIHKKYVDIVRMQVGCNRQRRARFSQRRVSLIRVNPVTLKAAAAAEPQRQGDGSTKPASQTHNFALHTSYSRIQSMD